MITKAYPHLVAKTENPRVLKFAGAPVANKVGIVTGGGSGHKPAFIGYIGKNLCDAVAVGEIFTSPSAQGFLDAFKAADSGKGVACLCGNYAGDNLNVKMARQLAELDGIQVKTVIANDDVPSAPKKPKISLLSTPEYLAPCWLRPGKASKTSEAQNLGIKQSWMPWFPPKKNTKARSALAQISFKPFSKWPMPRNNEKNRPGV
jgi:hypothetical protein